MPTLTALFTLASCAVSYSSCDDNPIYRMMLPMCPMVVLFLLLLVFLGRRET